MDYVEHKFGRAIETNSKAEAQKKAKERKDRIERANRLRDQMRLGGHRVALV